MVSTWRQLESRKTNVVLFFSFKLNTDSFIRSIYCNVWSFLIFFLFEINQMGTKGQL